MQGSYGNAKICYICKEKLLLDHSYYIGEYRGAAHSICDLEYSAPKTIPIFFHNGPNYDYHFIIKELPEEFKKQYTCLGEKAEKRSYKY